MMSVVKLYSLVLVAALVVGCAPKENSGDPEKTALSAGTGSDVLPVEVIDVAGVKQLLRERNGKVLFLNLWATWCVPCVEEFPDIVELADEMSDNVEFVAISFDYPDEVESKIQPFIKEHKVNFRVLVAETSGDPEEIMTAIDPDWNGALPTTLVYDASGKRRSFLVGQRSYEQFKKELDKARMSS